jgi:arabinofuranosyltransferase
VKRWWAIFAVFGLLFYFNAYVCDDAFITFRAVDNFVRGYGLRWNAADRVQVFTSPLFTVLFALPYSVIFDRSAIPNPSRAYWLAIALSFVLSMGIVVSLRRAIERTSTFIALFAVLMASQAFVTFTSSGLETPLCLLVVALFYGRWLRGDPREMRGYGWLLALAAATVLTRQDLVLLMAPATLQLVITGWRRYGRRLLVPVAAATAPLVAWHAFSLVYYGFLLPNSYYAKLGLDAPSSLVWSLGRHYFAACLRQDPVTVAVCGLALLVCVTDRRLLIAGAGILMHLLYICSIGGDFIGYRFLAPPFLVSALILAKWLDAVETRRPVGLWRIAVAAAAVYSLVVPYSPVRAIRDRTCRT